MKDLHCIGCGGKLQNEDKDKPFYTPKSLEENTSLYCMRCFRMRNYGEVMPSHVGKDDYISMIGTIPKDSTLAKVIDIFDIEGSILPQITTIAQSRDLIIIANKRDLLPKSAKDSKIKHRLNKILADYGLNPKSIHLISAMKNQGVDTVLEAFEKENRDIYIVGAANTGKSTLINHMISATAARQADPITTFFAPGTTQAFIEIPFGEHTIYDTPGLIKQNHFFNLLDPETIKALQPKKEIKPKSYQLEANQTIFIGGLARMDFITGLPATFVFYVSQNVTLHRTKLINADVFFEKHQGTTLTPALKEAPSFKIHQFPLKREHKSDVVIPGIGHFTIEGSGVVRLYLPEGVTPYHREALIG